MKHSLLLLLASSILLGTGNIHAYAAPDQEAASEFVPKSGEYSSINELNGKTIGIQTGTSFDAMVKDSLPKSQLSYYNSQTDLLVAIESGKIDAFPVDEPVIRYIMGEDDKVTYIPEYLESFDFAFAFPKTSEGQKICDEVNEFLDVIAADGTMEELETKWFGSDESTKNLPDYKNFPAPNGKLVMASDATYMPFEYVRGDEVVGYDVDMIALFCQEYGYGLEIKNMGLDAVLPAIQSGKCDFGGSAITITPERAESVLFSKPNYSGGIVFSVRSADDAGSGGFFAGIKDSFNKTFIREDRWKLFLQGIGNTLIITALSVLLGTALGFVVFMLCRGGNPIANHITGFCTWLIQGMPMVVLLMILYYVVFGKVAISGMIVAIIGFTLTFGAAVLGMLQIGIGMVDKGQYEAAYALGYSYNRTFFKIVLPQALPHMLPAYKGEIIGLLKATAIVGYIAVQDLTKMGDIVRSRTYEAFFPLISITVIYFFLEYIFSFIVGRLQVGIDPKRRKADKILRGIKTDD